jgi:hypothetical protein
MTPWSHGSTAVMPWDDDVEPWDDDVEPSEGRAQVREITSRYSPPSVWRAAQIAGVADAESWLQSAEP